MVSSTEAINYLGINRYLPWVLKKYFRLYQSIFNINVIDIYCAECRKYRKVEKKI